MKKVKYGITRYSKKGSYRFTGYGIFDGNDLITKYKDVNGNQVEHRYEDVMNSLHPVINTTNEFKGGFYEYEEIEFENEKGQLIELEIEVDYHIWIRILN